ncbi:MAG: hypothetical protein ACRD0L_02490, partial [Acidimicrobiales bacterium]
MSGYVDAGYTVVLACLAAYSTRVVRRRKVLSRAVPPAPRAGSPAAPAPAAAPVPASPAGRGGPAAE